MALTILASSSRPPVGLAGFVAPEGPATVVTLRGDADHAARDLLVDLFVQAIAEGEGAVIVDLTETELVCSASVEVLADAWQFLRDRGRGLALRAPSALVVEMVAAFGLPDLRERP